MARDKKTEIKKKEDIEELEGKLEFSNINDKLMHSVLENDKDAIEKGKLLQDAVNRGLSSFNPDLMFDQMVKNFKLAKQIYGERIIRFATGYGEGYVEKNIRIPEFQKELKQRMDENTKELEKEKLLKDDNMTDKALELASLVMYTEELENLNAKGMKGEKESRKKSYYGEKGDVRKFRKGDRYDDISIKKSIRLAVKRGHDRLRKDDLKAYERESKGSIEMIYALDASGSMKGEKIGACKKAGVVLSYKAIEREDKVGLIVFGSEIKEKEEPSKNFPKLLKKISAIRAGRKTDFVLTIKNSIDLFSEDDVTKHLVLLTDAMPTVGKEEDVLEAVSAARAAGISVSLIGVGLEKGKELAENIVNIGEGRLYIVKNLSDVDEIVLEDYYSVI
ncbi:VWA domain-containing protein [Candidatus Woesearchaeota archaeon]|nr:VWA domain-containing protein [Candidatus Woesearchaeota archaeon]